MDIEFYRTYCLNKKGVTQSLPFSETALVFKVQNKMFALTNLETFDYVNLKCDPEKCIELRETFKGVKPGYHMNKKHWNSVYLNMDVDDQLLVDLIDESYRLVVKSLTNKLREELQNR